MVGCIIIHVFKNYTNCFIGNGNNNSKFKLSEKFKSTCSSGKDALLRMCKSIENGDVTLMELSMLEKNEKRISDLLVEVKRDVNKLQLKLKQRYHERSLFAERLDRLRKVCESINFQIEGN